MSVNQITTQDLRRSPISLGYGLFNLVFSLLPAKIRQGAVYSCQMGLRLISGRAGEWWDSSASSMTANSRSGRLQYRLQRTMSTVSSQGMCSHILPLLESIVHSCSKISAYDLSRRGPPSIWISSGRSPHSAAVRGNSHQVRHFQCGRPCADTTHM